MKKQIKKQVRKNIPWTLQDEEILLNNIRGSVTNLNAAFKKSSKELQRTPAACAARWYSRTSIQSGHCLFLTMSGTHVSVNRKNGKGTPTTVPLYKKILSFLGLSY